MSSNAVPAPHRQARILACVLCQHRKIKCDRNSPCSNCIKANVPCVPSTPAPARKRRRPNQDLQERLARCEELLKQYANGTAPVSAPRNPTQPPVTPSPAWTPSDAVTATPASGDSQQSFKPARVTVQEDGSVNFMDSFIWASVYDELQKMRDIVETDDPEDSSVLGSDELTPDNSAELFLTGEISRVNLEELQPDGVHTFALWKLFLDRVNPLTKLIHAPTMQPYVLEAATNMSSLPFHYQGLLFSIFAMAAISMSPIECVQTLGVSRDTAIHKFNMGTKVSLTKFNFLKNFNMTALQALALFLLSLEGRYDRHTQWLISGTVIRIAQKMGYHRDGALFNLNPYETEMRRRIWWHIVMLDTKCAMMSGLSGSLFPGNWDTKMPSNLNDADLRPGSTEPVVERDGPTEMAFLMIINRIFQFKLHTEDLKESPAFEAAFMGQTLEVAADAPKDTREVFEKFRSRAQELEKTLLDLEERLIDVSAGNVHIAALAIRPMLTHRLSEMLIPMQDQPEWGTEIFSAKDNFFKVIIMTLEHKSNAHERMAAAGFQWFMRMHFQLDFFAVFTGMLYDRPLGSLTDRAWNVMHKVYSNHSDLLDMSIKQHVIQAQFTLKAWKAREAALAGIGQPVETPELIVRLREVVPYTDKSTPQGSSTSPAMASVSQPMDGYNQFLGGYLDVSTVNWEVFGEFLPNNGDQLSAAMFDGYDLGSMNMASTG